MVKRLALDCWRNYSIVSRELREKSPQAWHMWRSVSSDDILEQTRSRCAHAHSHADARPDVRTRSRRISVLDRDNPPWKGRCDSRVTGPTFWRIRRNGYRTASQRRNSNEALDAEGRRNSDAWRAAWRRARVFARWRRGTTSPSVAPEGERDEHESRRHRALRCRWAAEHTYRWLKSGTAPDEVTMGRRSSPRAVSAGNATQAQLDHTGEVVGAPRRPLEARQR